MSDLDKLSIKELLDKLREYEPKTDIIFGGFRDIIGELQA